MSQTFHPPGYRFKNIHGQEMVVIEECKIPNEYWKRHTAFWYYSRNPDGKCDVFDDEISVAGSGGSASGNYLGISYDRICCVAVEQLEKFGWVDGSEPNEWGEVSP